MGKFYDQLREIANNEKERKEKLAQQTAPVSFATGERVDQDFAQRHPFAASIIQKTVNAPKVVKTLPEIQKMNVPFTVDRSDYDTYGQRVQKFMVGAKETLGAAKPSTIGTLKDLAQKRSELGREGTGLMMYAGGNGLDQSKIERESNPLIRAYTDIQEKETQVGQYGRDVDYELGENVRGFEDYKRILEEYGNPDERKAAALYGMQHIETGTGEITEKAAAAATDAQLDRMYGMAKTWNEKNIINAEKERRKAGYDEERAGIESELARVNEEIGNALYTPGMTQEKYQGLLAEAADLRRRLDAVGVFIGPEMVAPETQAYFDWAEAGKNELFGNRYLQEKRRDAADWAAVREGEYQGDDEEKSKASAEIQAAQEELDEALRNNVYYTGAPGSVIGISAEDLAAYSQKAEEAKRKLDALTAQADEKARAAAEENKAFGDQLEAQYGKSTLGEAIWKSTKSGIANFFTNNAATAVDVFVKPWEVLGEYINAQDKNLTAAITGDESKKVDVNDALDNVLQNGMSQQFIDKATEYRDEMAQEAQRARLALTDSPVWDVAQQVYINFIEQVPELAILLAMGLGGAGKGAMDGIARMRKEMMGVLESMQGASQSTASGKAISNMLQNPSFWTTFGREFEDDIASKGGGSTDYVLSRLKGTLEALINSGLEVGPEGTSGWQGFGQNEDAGLAQRIYEKLTGKKAGGIIQGLDRVGRSMIGEGVEEGTQGLNSNAWDAMQRAIETGEGTKVLSTEAGENALVNVPDQLREMAIGGLGGLFMGGAMDAINAPVQIAGTRAEAKTTGQRVIDNNLAQALGGIAEDTAGIKNGLTESLRNGTADLSQAATQRDVGKLWQKTMKKLDKGSYAALNDKMVETITKRLNRNGFGGTQEQVHQAAQTIAKGYTEGLDSLNAAQRALFKNPQMRQAYRGLTGDNTDFTAMFSKSVVQQAKDASAAARGLERIIAANKGGFVTDTTEAAKNALEAAKGFAVSEDGKTHMVGAEGEAEIVGVKVLDDGKMQMLMKAAGEKTKAVDVADVRFASPEIAEEAALAAAIGGKDMANTLFNAKDPTGTAEFGDYAKSMMEVAKAAAAGLDVRAAQAVGLGKGLTNLEARTAAAVGSTIEWSRQQAAQAREAVDQAQRAYVRSRIEDALKRDGAETRPVDAEDMQAMVTGAIKAARDGKITPTEKATLEKYGIGADFVNGIREAVKEPVPAPIIRQAAPDTYTANGEGFEAGAQPEMGAATAEEFGRSGRSYEELIGHLEAEGLPITSDVRTAYTRGESARRNAEIARNAEIEAMKQRGKQSAPGTVRTVSAEELNDPRMRARGVNAVKTEYSEKQQAAVDALGRIAAESGLNFVLYESSVNGKGERVGANGFYDGANRTIYLDLFAGQENDQAIMRAAAHEITHAIKDWSPTEYRHMQDYLLKAYYGQDRNTVARLIQHQMDVARQNGRAISETEAMEEVVADASEMMFSNPEVLRGFAQENPTVFQRIKDWIDRFLNTIRKAMAGVNAQSPEARMLTGMEEQWKQYQKLWLTAAKDAAENLRGAGDTTATVQTTQKAPEAVTVRRVDVQKAASMRTAEQNQAAMPAQAERTGNAQAAPATPERAAESQNKGTAYTNDQTPVQFHYEAVPADSLVTSNNQRFEANPEYPQELQPRDRSRQASRDQVWSIARNLNPARLGESADVQNGAPIVGPDLVVESGNGRAMAIRYAMQNSPEQAGKYTAWLREHAAEFGLNANDIRPDSVLVRVRDSALDRVQFVKQANESTTAAYSESETAESDAEKMDAALMEVFSPGENGSLTGQDNVSFVNRFMREVIPAAERGNYMQQDGSVSQRGYERMQNAIFQKAYGSAQLTQMLSESTDEGVRNALKALLMAAPRVAQTMEAVKKGLQFDIGLGEALTAAARRYAQLKRDGYKVGTYLNQTMMPGLEAESAGAQALMRIFEDYNRAPKQLAGVIRSAMDVLAEYGDPNQTSLLGENTAPGLENVIAQAVARENAAKADGIRNSLRDTASDADYMQAVEDGDMLEAQRLVDEAVETAMPQSKVRDEDGKLLMVFHGTDATFTVFDMSKGRANMDIQGSFFSPWELEAEGYGPNVGRYYLNIKNPAPEGIAYKALNMFKGQNGAGFKARERLIAMGYDGVNNGNEEYIAFYPWQIKSADAITEDDAGNVIPLSERFNDRADDIRYSLRYTEGNGVEEGMTDGERYEKLKGTQIQTADATDGLSAQELQPFKTMSYRVASRPLTEIARRYGLIRADGTEAKTLTNAYLPNLSAKFSRASLDESISNQKTGLANMAALMPVFEETYKNAVPVLVQGNRYLYTAQDESRTEGFMYLLGGFRYNESVIPVQFELKQNVNADENSIYVVATIKKDAITVLETANAASRATAPSIVSIEDLIGLVKGDETKILANLPSQFLTEEQKEGKRKGLREKGRHTNEKAAKAGRDVNAPINMTEERIDRDIAYYGESGDYSKAYMTYISPSDYLRLTTANEERIANESRVMVAAEMRENEQTPFLRFDPETGEITGHEGRHRMMAMKNAGVQQVAILVIPDGSEGRYSRQTITSMQVSGQDFGFAKATGTVTLNNLIPVNQKHRQELVDTYGESRSWFRYSARDAEYRTNRQILGAALMEIAANAEERDMLGRYQDMAARLDADERRIGEINEELRSLRLDEPNSEREKALLAERRELERGILDADRQLYSMERMAPLQNVANRQRAKAENDLARAKEHMRRYREGMIQREYQARIEKTSRRLARWLTAPAGKSNNYVPESLRAPLGEFLLTIDKMSQQRRMGGPMTESDRKFAYQLSQIRSMLESIDDAQSGDTESQINEQYGMYMDLPKDFTKNLSELVRRVEDRMESAGAREGGNMLDQMTVDELEALDQSLTAISSSITHINDFLTGTFSKSVSETAAQTIRDMGAYRQQGRQAKWARGITDFVTWDNLMPSYAFDRLGESGKAIFGALREGQSRLAFNAKRVIDESEKIYTAKEAQAWSKEIREFDLAGEKVRMPVSHLMSLYALSRREQGLGHLLGEGIRVADFTEGRNVVHDKGHVISEAELKKMLDTLTPRQKQVAEGLQHLMSTLGSEWGNHVSMRRFGYRQFTERHYFPIRSDSDLLAARTDEGKGNELYRLLNMSMTKPLVQRANNRLMLDSIFDVYAGHMSDMAQYNALALPVLDAVKWINYKESTQAEGESAKYTQGVRDSIRNALGQSAIKYLTEFLKDINGGGMVGDTSANPYQKALGRYNRVAVAANLRVALLQPLAIIRAGIELPGTSLASGTIKAIPRLKSEVEEMQAHSGIALWKDLGYREMNIGRSLKQQIQHMETWQDKVSDKSMALAGLMDNVTWGAMWKASKEYIQHTRPELRAGSKEYFEAVTQKFEDVVYKTQVVDSPLTKSQLMRSQNAFNKLIGSFMSEPTTTFNTLMAAFDGFRLAMRRGLSFSEAWKKNGAKIGRTMFYYLLAAAVNTAIEQAMTAYRDDDDYETMKEKYMDGFWQTMIDNANPLTLIPGIKQIWETGGKKLLGMDTFDDQSVLTQGINTTVDGIQKIMQGKGTAWGKAYTLAKGLSMTSGLPVSPLMREFQALWNQTAARINPNLRLETTATPNKTGYDIMYRAYDEHDAERYEQVHKRLTERGADEQTIQTAMSTRIKADYMAGEISGAEAESRLVELAGKKENDAYFKVQEWAANAEGSEEDYSRFDALKNAMLTGQGYEAAKKELTDHGYTEKQVTAKAVSIAKDAAKKGEINDSQAEQMMVKYGGVDKNDAYFKVQSAHYEKSDEDDSYQKYGKLEEAVLTGKGFEAAKKELTDHGTDEKDVTSKVRSIITEQVVKNGMTDEKAVALLKQYGGMDENEAWIRTQEMAYQKATGKATSSDTAMVIYAVDSKQSPKAAIDGLLAHGKKKDGIASSITSHYKAEYLELRQTNPVQAAELKGRLITIFDYLGYKGAEKIYGWENPKKKKGE